MGPTNQALVKLFEADRKYRTAQSRYDAVSRDVRIQDRRHTELISRETTTSRQLKELQAKAANAELDIKTRDSRIERLREQQQTAKNNKEYQAFLVEINTEKVDKAKVEDDLLKMMEQIEKLQAEVTQLQAQAVVEKQKLDTMQQEITGRLQTIQSEIEQLKPDRDAARAAVPGKVVELFDRLAERFEGEALAPIEKPDRRVEEYICGACNMWMSADIYNRLHSRDEPVFCPSCRRFLYIPEDLPPEAAINQKKKGGKKSGNGNGEEKADSESSPETADTPAA